jgi:hypothetical protein
MATTRRVKIYVNQVKNIYMLKINDSLVLRVTPWEIIKDGDVVAVGDVAKTLYNALATHNRIALSQALNNLLPVIQLLST